jgi:hypothetical protein
MLANMIDRIVYLRPPRTRSAKTTNLDRIASDLLDDVMQGLLTVQEAAAHYGSKTTRTNGRPRRFPTFADYIADRARYAVDPEVERELLDLLTMLGGRGSRGAQAARTVRVNKLLAVTGAEHAARLQAMLHALLTGDAHAG